MEDKKSSVRVIVSADGLPAQEKIRGLLAGDSGVCLIGEVANDAGGVQLILEKRPDLLVMNITEPAAKALAVIEAIMQERPTPILVVNSGNCMHLEGAAGSRGALEVVSEPGVAAGDQREFIRKIKLLAGVAVIRHLAGARNLRGPLEHAGAGRPDGRRAVAIASSLGGARVLAIILGQLPAGFSAPILVAQHISEGFAEALAEWLNQKTALDVCLARQGATLTPGRVFIAPPEYHMQVDGQGKLDLAPSQPADVYHPSCDTLLSSVARVYRQGAIGLILTGMGQDGVRGIQAIKAAGGVTIAQNEQSSLIYNMPRLAKEQGLIDYVAAAEEIAATLIRVMS